MNEIVIIIDLFICSDENYFKDLKVSQNVDKTLWLVHLVQLKKLFLKLSSYVELYLKQDWSLLPVPDFKLVSRSDLVTGHLNFMVAAVLLTATHSGKNLEYERILELVIPTGLRKDIKLIQDAFMMALEPKILTNSPRRTFLTTNNTIGITPKVLFPTNLSTESECESECKNDIKLQEIEIKEEHEHEPGHIHELSYLSYKYTEEYTEKYTEKHTELCANTETETVIDNNVNAGLNAIYTDNSADKIEISLNNEIKLLEIKLEEMEKSLKIQKETEILQSKNLFETFEELQNLKERQEYEKIERNSLMAAFDHEKQILDDQIEILRRENYETNEKLINLSIENETLKQDQENNQDQEDLSDHKHEIDIEEITIELNQCKLDNSKLVRALKKARDHILKQDAMIKELKEELENTEKSREEEIKILKESFEFERNEMNRVLIELGGTIQRSNLLNL